VSAPEEQRTLIVGGGRMGEALLGGLLAAGWNPDELVVAEVSAPRREELAAAHTGVAVVESVVPAAAAVLAVKPADIGAAARAVADAGARRVLSVAAGVTTRAIEDAAGRQLAVVRVMPNTPALIGAGAAAISPGSAAEEADLAWAERVLGAVGVVVRVPESALDAVTGLSGSGPAYVFLVAEALVDGAVLNGLPRDVAETLAYQTLLGSARLLVEGESDPAALRAAVTSPGGTTAAGLRELERGGVRAALIDAVSAATARSRELGSASPGASSATAIHSPGARTGRTG
jgi:pyrroline-5-carboxylate reductase